MENIVSKFYNQSIENGGVRQPKLTSNKFSSPNLLDNRYNRTIGNPYNNRYNNGQRIMENAPVPRTQYSMGLNVPTIRGSPPLYQSVTNPFREMENPYSTLNKNYSPNKYKLNILDNRIREMEDENKRNKLKIQRLMEGSSFSPEKPYWNSNPDYVNNPNSLNEAMSNLRNPYLTMEEFKNKQDMRRNIVQYELEKARQRINEGNNNPIIIEQQNKKEKDYTISNYSSNEEGENESSIDELDIKMKKEYNKLLKEIKKEREYNEMNENDLYNIEDKLMKMERQNQYNNEALNLLRQKNQEMYNALRSKEEAEDFMNSIPDHVALQLQNDNFKIRSNLNTIKEGFREIKNELENKLESLELKQNYNFEIIKRIIEEGGNRRMRAGFRKYMNNEEVDLNNINYELPEHLQFLPDLIERKIKENEEMKNQEKNRLINERMNKKFDMMQYNYGYANNFYKYKNRYRPNNAPNNNNFVISKNYGRFQYIPNKTKKTDTFKQNAEQNLMIMREKENNIPGIYAYGVGNKNMKERIPIKMNGCYDDWFRDKNSGEYQIEKSESDVGINVLKKKIKTKSKKSKSLKSKEIKKEESSSPEKESKKKGKEKKKDKKDKKEDKKEESESGNDDDEEGSEESDEESEKDKDTKKEDKKDDKKKEGDESGSDDDEDDEDSDDSDE